MCFKLRTEYIYIYIYIYIYKYIHSAIDVFMIVIWSYLVPFFGRFVLFCLRHSLPHGNEKCAKSNTCMDMYVYVTNTHY